jgi:hypothetical protein
MTAMTAEQFAVIASVIGEDLDPATAAKCIRDMHQRPDGADMLRVVVRDFPESIAAERIISALWVNL